MYDRRTLLATGGLALAGLVAGCSDSSSEEPTTTGASTYGVDMTDGLKFDPAELSVAAGDTVVWETVGTVGHSVTAYGARIPEDAPFFASGGFDAESAARTAYPDGRIIGGDAYEHTFEVAGRYAYFCVPHERAGMRGTIEVG